MAISRWSLPCLFLSCFSFQCLVRCLESMWETAEESPFLSRPGSAAVTCPVQDCADSQTYQEWMLSFGFTGLLWIYPFTPCPLGVWLLISSRNFLSQVSCGKHRSRCLLLLYSVYSSAFCAYWKRSIGLFFLYMELVIHALGMFFIWTECLFHDCLWFGDYGTYRPIKHYYHLTVTVSTILFTFL